MTCGNGLYPWVKNFVKMLMVPELEVLAKHFLRQRIRKNWSGQ
jgi:hypothetical protein